MGTIYPYSREAAPQPESPRFSDNMFFSYPTEIRTNKESITANRLLQRWQQPRPSAEDKGALQTLLREDAPLVPREANDLAHLCWEKYNRPPWERSRETGDIS